MSFQYQQASSSLTLNHQKGFHFESQVNSTLRTLPKPYFRIFHDILLPTPAGTTTQIDFLVLSIFGVFVCEVKNLTGKLVETPLSQSKYWLLNTPTGTNVEVYSPILQNNTHITAVAPILHSILSDPIKSLLVFSDSVTVEASHKLTFTLSSLMEYINSLNTMIYFQDEVSYMYQLIAEQVILDKSRIKEHGEWVEGLSSPSGYYCIKCKKPISKNRAKVSKTLCSKFPRCTYS